jgi:hypothetical protein
MAFSEGQRDWGSWEIILALVASNVVLFAVIGFLIGFMSSRIWVLVALCVSTCVMFVLIESYVFRSDFRVGTWIALLVTFILYATPFEAVRRALSSGSVHPVI